MKTCKKYGIAAAAWAALVCTVAVTATAAEGDIWSILRASGGDYGLLTPNPSMSDNPLTAGQKVNFKFRLLNKDPKANIEAYAAAYGISPNAAYAGPDTWNNMWQLLAKNPASGKVATNLVDMVNATNFPAKVGVWVSGRCQWADIERVDLVTDNYDFSDIVCSYTAQPGDFGLLTLAAGTEAQPVEAATEGTGAYSYLLKNSRYWGFFDAMTKTNACNLWLTSLQESDVSAYVTFPADDTPRWVQDRDMSQAGIYIKTIDFDDSKFNDDVWRRIAAGGTSAYVSNGNAKRAPALSIPGAVATDHTVTLYAWAEDESVAYLKNGVEKDFVTNGVTVTRHVAHITIEPADGEIKEIPGGILAKEDATNKTTRIFLSATPTNIFRSGVLVTNFVTKTVLVGAPEPPSIVVTINDQSDYTAVAGSPDDYDPVLPITIGFEGVESYTSPIDVTVTAEMINSAADTVEFVGLSRTNSNDPNSYGASATVTIPANSSSAFIYAYVKRASSETSDATKGISLKATVTDPAAISYFAGGIHAGTLHIQAAKPKITAPATDTVYDDVPAGEEYEMSFNVSDAYGELSGHYTLEYTLTGIWSSMNTKTLDLGVPSGSDNTLTTNLIFNTTSSNILVRVRNQDDHVSDPIHLTVNVFSKPLINATPYDHVGSDDNPSRTYDEGDIAKLTFTLDTPFALADAGYIFLVPQTDASSNLVDTTAFEQGIRIVRGQSTTDRQASLQLLDGAANTELRYEFEIWSTPTKTEAGAVRIGTGTDGYASGEITLYVENVMPTVEGVSMSDTPLFTNNGTMEAKAAKDVTKIFKIESVNEPSETVDLDDMNFLTEWKFYEGGAVLFTTNVYGNPYLAEVPYAFHNSGTNKVTVKVMDKDMTQQQFKQSAGFTFFVETLDEPTISLMPYHGSFYLTEENFGSLNGRVDVKLNIAPTETIVVKIEIERAGASDGLTRDPVLNTNLLTFTTGTTSRYFYFTELDGDASCFVKARVITETQSVDPNKTWAEFYHLEEEGGYPMTVDNVSPVIQGVVDTNAIPASIDVRGYTIKWSAKDVLPDVREGMTVSWTVEGATEDVPITVTNTAGIGLGTVSGTYSPLFTSAGPKTVTLRVTDKNGGYDVRYYYFNVEPSKDLYLYPLGPRKRAVSSFSSYYFSAAGRGAGRVWVENLDPKISGFEQRWTLAPALDTINVYGYGYRVGESATGTLAPGRDFRLDVNGNLVTNNAAVALYAYENQLYDSFFYCWILDTKDESGNWIGAHLGAIQPAVGTNTSDFAAQPVILPDYDTDTVQYDRRYVEGVFSREYLPKDNVGDINQDGIPDIYASGVAWSGQAETGMNGGRSNGETAGARLFEIAGYTSESAGDLKDLRGYNDDNDYLPSKTSSGGTLIPGIQSDWATYGDPFNAYLELRGWGDGLNYREDNSSDRGRNTLGNWISERDFSPLEMVACSNAWIAAGSPGNFEAFTDWSPENRTDPTISDTDGDGMPDGYEYYFWYRAYVGYFEYDSVGGTNVYKRLNGSRFRLQDIAEGTPITADEIAEAFNPNVYVSDVISRDTDNDGLTDLEEFAMGTNPIHWDTDGDGISDYWEVMRGLNPVYAERDSVDSESNPDDDYMAECVIGSDYAVLVFPADSLGIHPMYAVPDNGSDLIDSSTGALKASITNGFSAIPVYRYGDASSAVVPLNRGIWTNRVELSRSYKFKCEDLRPERFDCRPLAMEAVELGDVAPSDVTVLTKQTLKLVHEQVRAQFGFDPRTGWYCTKTGYVSPRWDPSANRSAANLPDGGLSVNTRPFRNKDEYLLLKYRYMTTGSFSGEKPSKPTGSISRVDAITRSLKYDLDHIVALRTAKSDELTIAKIFLEGTTNPNLRYTGKTYGNYSKPSDSEESSSEENLIQFSSRIHGADSDCDGVPDGWELYVGFDPNDRRNGWGDMTEAEDVLDDDGLSLVNEYAGTDSCNMYSNAVSVINRQDLDSEDDTELVATVFENHPGVRPDSANDDRAYGWFNKFFPTDPWDGDTDGDHVGDGGERARNFGQAVIYHRVHGSEDVIYAHSFCYPVNEDDDLANDGKTLCFRGGGLNPCSIDTDFDNLPDKWEMQYAGVLFTPAGLPDGVPLDDEWITLMRRSDGLKDGDTAKGYYVSGGMDGTLGWNIGSTRYGDVFTDPDNSDERTGTCRDYDFDHDGLQNFQEYLVQVLRHLRFDDSETPLMGRWMPSGSPDTETFVGFLPMNVMDGDDFFATTKKKGFVGNGGWQFRELGYFAPPPREWDPAALRQYKFLLPPHGLGPDGARMSNVKYVSTDPRLWDSDFDGMDDYYELFHGLNPLLGSVTDMHDDVQGTITLSLRKGDVICESYSTYLLGSSCWLMSFWNNAWLGWPGDSGKADYEWLGTGTYTLFDPIRYPWMMGAAEADADGDGIRNAEEALIPNMSSPQPTHTDPTPLWLTDSTAQNKASYVAQYYLRPAELDSFYPWKWKEASGQASDGASSGYLFSFEENEGYDTDHDWISDGEEQRVTATTRTEPLDFTDPDRRQALWFPGDKSAAVSRSDDIRRLNYASYDFLRQFTIEAWIKPDADGTNDQVILERACWYGASTLSNSLAQIRANFLLGLRAETNNTLRLYGQYDTSDAVPSGTAESVSRVLGLAVPTDRWTHVALTYDGVTLKLYMDGAVVASEPTSAIPANGIVALQPDAYPGMVLFPVVGNGYSTVPSAMVIGARVVGRTGLGVTEKSTWADYAEFYKGYIDEVRVWDGAQSMRGILEGKDKRFSFADVSALRDNVHSAWAAGATRNDNDGKPTLPAELVMHYNFQSIPGATDPKYVAWEPSGFTKNVKDNGRVDGWSVPGDIYCGWWYGAAAVRSTVYKNWRLVPWIQNTVAHLPSLDGSAVDSRYWSEFAGGLTISNEVDVAKILFPNVANPYPYYFYTTERYYHKDRLERMANMNLAGSHMALTNYLFELRSNFVGGSDLVPLGGAFAKRCTDMWDDNGPMDAWTMTLRDTDANGIPDWWENVAIANYGATAGFGWDTDLTWEGRTMSAREAYIRDLQRGMMPTSTSFGVPDPAFENIADSDNDGLPAWWEDPYGIRSQNGLDDADNDQLSNYAEYLIGECFFNHGMLKKYNEKTLTRRLSPIMDKTYFDELDQKVPDYFLKVCKPYLGEMLADHDFMEDAWEDLFDPDFVSRFKFDAWNDPDNDGWSNWAECRADTDPTLQSIAAVDGYTLVKYPVPDLTAMIVCGGDTTLDAPIYVQAYPSSDTSGMPDAVWQIGSSEKQTKYLGMNPNSVMSFTLGSGSVRPGSVIVQLKSSHWIDNEGYIHYLSDAAWVDYIHDTVDTSVPGEKKGVLFFGSLENTVGSINYSSGEVVIDFSKCRGEFVVGQSGSHITYFPDESFFVIKWDGVVPNSSTALTVHLRDPLPAYAEASGGIWEESKNKHPSKGAVREGLNTFVAFLDLNSDGTWSPGEPYGVVPNVDVSWAGTSFKIELTRTTPEMVRINLRDAVAAEDFETQNKFTDRGLLGGGSVPANVAMPAGTNMPLQTMTDVRVRIALDTINGRRSYNYVYTDDVVFDQRLNLAVNPLLTEKNLLATGKLDLEWGTLGAQASRIGLTPANVTQAVYRVVLGNGPIQSSKTNNTLAVGFVNAFDVTQPTCTLLSSQGAVFSQPTFTWRCDSPIGKSYPAFQLRLYTARTGGTLIYDSGARRAPVRDMDGNYSWTAPIYPEMMTPNGQIFSTTNNYFWEVSMLDAKFTGPSGTQPRQEFRQEASGQLGKISDYGMLKAKVRYFGPGTVATDNVNRLIHVQAFTSPDFTGMPAGEAYVTDVSQISAVTNIDVNAVILGIKPGKYYVRAFIDSDGDAKWSKWESWGYGNFVGAWDAALESVSRGQVAGAAAGSAYVFTPRPYTVAVGEEPPVVDIYIEDMDSDADHLPDIYEYDTEGSLTARSTPTGNTFFTRVNTNLAAKVEAYLNLNASSVGKTYAPITLMSSIISGSDPAVLAAGIDFLTDSSAGRENVAVKIDSFSLTDGLAMSITSDVPATEAGDLSFFVTTDSANVKVILVASDSPDFANAKETVVKTITIKANAETKEGVSAEELRAAIDAAGFGDAAFFKVRLEQ